LTGQLPLDLDDSLSPQKIIEMFFSRYKRPSLDVVFVGISRVHVMVKHTEEWKPDETVKIWEAEVFTENGSPEIDAERFLELCRLDCNADSYGGPERFRKDAAAKETRKLVVELARQDAIT
jgi:hypothetical protein